SSQGGLANAGPVARPLPLAGLRADCGETAEDESGPGSRGPSATSHRLIRPLSTLWLRISEVSPESTVWQRKRHHRALCDESHANQLPVLGNSLLDDVKVRQEMQEKGSQRELDTGGRGDYCSVPSSPI